MAHILIVKLKLMRGLECNPVHKKLHVLINDLSVHQPCYNLINQSLIELLEYNFQHLPYPDIADFVLLIHIIHNDSSPHVVVDDGVDHF